MPLPLHPTPSVMALLFVLFLSRVVSAATASHRCMFDGIRKQAGTESVVVVREVPRRGQSGLQAYSAAEGPWAPIHIEMFAGDLEDPSKYCTEVGQHRHNFLNRNIVCTSDNILTASKRAILLEYIIPGAIKLHAGRLSVRPITGVVRVPRFTRGLCVPFTIPSEHHTTGVSGADMILYIAAGPSGGAALHHERNGDFAASLSLHAIRSFSASGSTSAQEYRERAGYIDVQETFWSDIAGLEKVKATLQRLVLRPLQHHGTYRRFGVRPSTGVLLSGPPGTGKTLLARAMATELNASFIYIDLPQLIQSEVGESERRLRVFFDVARDRSPSVIFMDELQAAFGSRYDATGRSGSTHDARLVSQLLHLLDKAHEDADHFMLFVGATNVKSMLDEALLRAGRLDTIVEVPLPDEAGRCGLVQRVVYGEWSAWFPNATASVDTEAARQALIQAFVRGTAYFTGAELRHTINVFALYFLRLIHMKGEGTCETPKPVDSVDSLQELLVDAKSRCLSEEAQIALTCALSRSRVPHKL